MPAANKDVKLDHVFDSVNALPTLRRAFFYEWLKAHFNLNERGLVREHLSNLDADLLKQELAIIRDEYIWCLYTPLERMDDLI